MKNKWCSHMTPDKAMEHFVNDLTPEYSHSYTWSFCPVCGTPRPRKKELWEKFDQAYYELIRDNNKIDDSFYKKLEKIAREHYREAKA